MHILSFTAIFSVHGCLNKMELSTQAALLTLLFHLLTETLVCLLHSRDIELQPLCADGHCLFPGSPLVSTAYFLKGT